MRVIEGFKCQGSYRRKGIQAYSNRMSKPDETHLWNDTVAHILEQQGFSIEEDPRSIYDPEQMWDSLARYSPLNDTYIDQKDQNVRQGINMAWAVFAKPKTEKELKALRSEEELLHAIKGEKFAGLPNMGKKRDDFIYGLNREEQVKLKLKAPAPCLAGKRTQRGNKTRLVWMYPMEMTLMEARFARPLIDTYLDRRTTMAFGMKKFAIGALVESIKHMDGTPVAMDYSKFDATISSYFIRQAFKIIGTWFTDKDKEELGFKIVENYFLHTPIVMIDGKLYTGKKHGVPSGSYFTQIVDSIVNTILIGMMSSEFKLGIQWTKFLVLGDDVIINIKEPDLQKMSEFLERFGIILSASKTKLEAHFLGANWYFGKPYRNFDELLAMAVQPESYKQMGNTEQERYTSAISLLINYSCTYTNAWRMLNFRFHSPQGMNYYEYDIRPELMSGSDRYIQEYVENTTDRSTNRTTLVRRFLA